MAEIAMQTGGDEDEGGKLKLVLVVVVIALLLFAIGFAVNSFLNSKPAQKKNINTVKILPDTPPPPPPPPPKEQPKEQPKDQPKEVKEVQQPKPDSPPAEALKMEGAAGDGPSPFQSGSVSNEYTGGEVSTKIGGGPSKYQFAYYTDLLKTQIEDLLAKDPTLATGAYKVVVKLWISASGKISKYELVSVTGDEAVDALIRKTLADVPPLSEPPPSDMPQPVKLRVTARSAG